MVRLKNHFTGRATTICVITILIFSVAVTSISSSTQKLSAQTGSTTTTANNSCQKLLVSSITAKGNDGHMPTSVLDNNLNTKWSNLAIGSFIQADLGEQKTICSVDIAWHRGNLRQNNFIISVSNDGTAFTPVFIGKSSGTTVLAEKYQFAQEITARFVRVTVDGNTENNWTSITELSVDGFSSITPQHLPPSQNTPIADNKTIQTNINTPVEITLTANDPDPGNRLTFSIARFAQHGGLSAGSAHNRIMYFPNDGFIGSDRIDYQATDSQGIDSNIATVTVTVNEPQNPHPSVDNKMIKTNINTPVEITLIGTDPDPRDVLKFSVVNLPQHGNVTHSITPNSILYTPDTEFSGTDSFTYRATDNQGVNSSNLATVIMKVNGSSPDGSNNLVDPFGIREIYPTKAGGEQWFMNMSDITHDPRTSFTASNPTLTRNPDGSWKVSSTEVRFNVFPSSGYHHELITTLNQQQLETKGYMQSPNDWKDVEITGYLKLNKQGGNVEGHSGALVGGHYTMYARGGKHIGFGAPQGGCESTSYHADWAYDGRTRFAKEQWHVSYVFTPYKSSTDNIIGKWVGFKMIMYNIQQNGKTAVKMEIWVDPNNNGNWVKVNDFVDSGGFGKGGEECGGAPDQIITWGGPITTYRWDNSPDVDVKDFSVREIQAPQ